MVIYVSVICPFSIFILRLNKKMQLKQKYICHKKKKKSLFTVEKQLTMQTHNFTV